MHEIKQTWLNDKKKWIINNLNRLSANSNETVLHGWSELLKSGEDLYSGVQLADPWREDGRISTLVEQLDSGIPRPPYSWSATLHPFDVSLVGRLLEFVDDARDRTDLCMRLLAIIDMGDSALKRKISKKLDSVGGIDPSRFADLLMYCRLVATPGLRDHPHWWPSRVRSATRGERFWDQLEALVPTPRPVRLHVLGELDLVSNRGGRDRVRKEFKIALVAVSVRRGEHYEFIKDRNIGDTGNVGFEIRHKKTPQWIDDCCNGNLSPPESDVLVFPELSVSKEAADAMARWRGSRDPDLPPYLIVAGSGHMEDEDGRLMNRTCLFFPTDESTSSTVAHLKAIPFKCRNSTEAIERMGGTEEDPLVVIESPWGRISALICRDAISGAVDGSDLLRSLAAAHVEHVFVPSWNPMDYREFRKVAEELARDYACGFYLVDGHEKKFPDNGRSPLPWIFSVPRQRLRLPARGNSDGTVHPWLEHHWTLNEDHGVLTIKITNTESFPRAHLN
uniref:Carbon-nitrogen hydrolase n=1 Tax=Candidatus Kentrum sp. DK TaxID=2126562 RepID=A0A450SXN4_9GAMM|nr:MAG: hypothetical protein BECKDK2373C_GA0170839_106817 [Candidatus Kentron sp. DK]